MLNIMIPSTNEIKILLGKKIKQYRKNKKLTQEQLAELINIEIPSLSNIETGKFAPSLETVQKLCEVLEVNLWELYFFKNLTETDMLKAINIKMESKPELIKTVYNFILSVE